MAFAGAVAVECVGGPRIPVQLGRCVFFEVAAFVSRCPSVFLGVRKEIDRSIPIPFNPIPFPHHHTPTDRTDAPAPNNGNPGAPGYGWSGLTGEGLVATMTKAGFGARWVHMCVTHPRPHTQVHVCSVLPPQACLGDTHIHTYTPLHICAPPLQGGGAAVRGGGRRESGR